MSLSSFLLGEEGGICGYGILIFFPPYYETTKRGIQGFFCFYFVFFTFLMGIVF